VKFEETPLPGVYLLQPDVFGDQRGFFLESWNRETFRQAGFDLDFVQDNHSRSARGILRGMHYQTEHTQGKLVRVTAGEVFDVVVDLRRDSPGLHAVGAPGLRPRLLRDVGFRRFPVQVHGYLPSRQRDIAGLG
jgi:dTDP-4-dehydrorhamnose 3,5-epimerase